MKLVLYSTSYCHLCEQAEALLVQLDIEAEYIDIVDDDELMERYGTRIPVIKRIDTGSELGWPFEMEILKQFLD